MSRLIELVDQQKWDQLFIEELGWSKPTPLILDVKLNIESEELDVRVSEIAQFRGIRIWVCKGEYGPREQRVIDRQVKAHSTERLIIFAGEKSQEWRWPQSDDDQGRGKTRLVSHFHSVGADNPALKQRLKLIEIGISESPSLLEILKRLRAAFNADRVTKAFYDKFKSHHEAMVVALEGFPDYEAEISETDKQNLNIERKWYSSLMMNRLMFIYFLQRKGFMDNDLNYLRNRLDAVRRASGPNRFYAFYSDFLIPMFHAGLGESGLQIEDAVIKVLVGDIPYINGGIFASHELEKIYDNIQIEDEVFAKIFDFFDSYQWHLDDRPSGNPNEINPDVLGHIFEQYVNQKQMGAYYTKEDVTHFMTSSTLLPVFIERMQEQTGINPWNYVSLNPERYIGESVSYGYESKRPFPSEIEDERSTFPRTMWGEKAPTEWGLPGETWWEVDHRRHQFDSLLKSIAQGEICGVDEATTANIDLETLALDVIDGLDNPDNVVVAWNILTELKVIDPTCGSGAFLFAALKILLGLYEATLDSARLHSQNSKNAALASIVENADSHPNQRYFLLKHTTLHNIYGVDLMKEATEIARLRLFLKLVAAIDTREHLEPLPDLDFNIKVGNVLVGALNAEEVAVAAGLFGYQEILDQANAAAEVVADSYESFRNVSEGLDETAIKKSRRTLTSALGSARIAINNAFFKGQGSSARYDDWVKSHVPFHWFIEFPEVFANGGFDVVVGNPPYVSKRSIVEYEFKGFETGGAPDIYAPCTERSAQITSSRGRMALIVPISAQFGADFEKLRKNLSERFSDIWVSTFSRNPAALFSAGLGVRSTILIGSGPASSGSCRVRVTKTHRWVDEFRPSLFETLYYVEADDVVKFAGWIRLTDVGLAELFKRVLSNNRLDQIVVNRGQTHTLGFKAIALYWLSAFLDDPPVYTKDLKPAVQTAVGRLGFANLTNAKIAFSVVVSKLGFVWWFCTGDDFHLTNDAIKRIPINVDKMSEEGKQKLVSLADRLIEEFPNHLMFTLYAGKWMGNYVISELRHITDEIDLVLAEEFGYVDRLPDLEHAYYCAFKPTGDRPGTLRQDPTTSI